MFDCPGTLSVLYEEDYPMTGANWPYKPFVLLTCWVKSPESYSYIQIPNYIILEYGFLGKSEKDNQGDWYSPPVIHTKVILNATWQEAIRVAIAEFGRMKKECADYREGKTDEK